MSERNFIVICQSAWMNDSGFGITYGWDGERFKKRKQAIKHGWQLRGSDDFNIAEISGGELTWFGWMAEKMDEDDATMAEIAQSIRTHVPSPNQPQGRRDTMSETQTDEMPEWSKIARYKLDSLKQRGWKVCGYAIQDEKGAYGFVTTGAFVGWWLPEYYPNHTSGDTPPTKGTTP